MSIWYKSCLKYEQKLANFKTNLFTFVVFTVHWCKTYVSTVVYNYRALSESVNELRVSTKRN